MLLCKDRIPFGKIHVRKGIINKNFSEKEMLAADELRFYLGRITTAPFQVTDDESDISDGIYLGSVSGLDMSGKTEDEFCIVFDEGKIRINGGIRGLFYGVYEFLEHLGCRFFTPTCEKIPLKTTLEVESFQMDGKPCFEYRDMDYTDVTRNAYYGTKMRLNGNFQHIPHWLGNNISYAAHAHSFSLLVPIEEYGEAHPEYYALRDGKRVCGVKDYWQLCLTNPDVLKIAVRNARKILQNNPNSKIISISQNDNRFPCQCEKCRKSDEEEGSPAGTLLRFVNAMAEELEPEFPDVLFDILAYSYTRPACFKTKARKNVCIRLCASSTCYTHSYEECDDRSMAVVHPDGSKTVFIDDLKAWSKVCDRLYIWDYVSNFQIYPLPFPNWNVLQKNIRTLRDHNVKGIFEEANRGKGGGIDFNELRCYLLCKLLWNPECNITELRNEFMDYYYGAAAPFLNRYLDLLCQYNEASNNHMYIQQRKRPPYLSDEHLKEYELLFEQAEKAVACDGLRLSRVQRNRLSVQYCEIYWKLSEDKICESEKVHEIFDKLHEFGVLKLDEWTSYQTTYRALLEGRTDGGRFYVNPPVYDQNETF